MSFTRRSSFYGLVWVSGARFATSSPTIAVVSPAAGIEGASLAISGSYSGAFAGTQIDYGWSTTNTVAPTYATAIAASPSGGAWHATVTYPASIGTWYLWVRETSATGVVGVAAASTATTSSATPTIAVATPAAGFQRGFGG